MRRLLGIIGCVLTVFLFLFWALLWFISDIDSQGIIGFVLNPFTIIVVIIDVALIRGGVRLIKGKPTDND